MTDDKHPPRDKDEGRKTEGQAVPSEASETPGTEAEENAPEGTAEVEYLAHELELEHDELKNLKSKLKKKEGEVKQLKKEKEELRDQLLRRLADMDNLKKRLERDKSDFFQYALADFIKELLPVLDSLERALERPDEGNGHSFQEGVRLIHKQFLDALRKRGVAPILDVVDRKFDPNHEQALATEESDEVEEPRVVEELQRGYTLNERLLRPALVKVRLPKKAQT
jgi:molecular chaperone GrpE